MAGQWALLGNIVITGAYAAITVAIVVPVWRAGQLFTNRLATATALIFFSCAVGHAFHAAAHWQAVMTSAAMPGMHAQSWSLWPSAAWDVVTAAVGVYYWSLRRGYGVLLGPGALFVDPEEQKRLSDIEVRERVAAARAGAEAERDAHAAMLQAVITNSQSLIYVKDLDGKFLLVNDAFERSFGVTSAEILGETDDYLDPQRAAQWQANDRAARDGAVRVEEVAESGGHQHVYESVKFPLFDAAGALYGVCGVALDVTGLRRAAEDAERARDEAVAQSQVKSEFLATMSHEIRTPMNGVLGLSSLLMTTSLTDAQRRYTAGIHSAGTALLTVINDILDVSKIEAGKLVLEHDDFDLPAVLTEVAALVTPAAADKSLTVVTRRGPGLPVTVRGDGGRIRQILLNLAGNAVKFTAQGSVTIRADLDPAGPTTVRFEVTDTGIGIAAADAERLFEPFTQADASTTRTYGGTGLGLAICRQLTEVMGGTLGVDSEPGQGSTFWCVIPFEAAATGSGAAAAPDAGGLRVLVVGDSPDDTALHADLRRWQMRPTATPTSAEAVHTLRDAARRGRPFDVLLIDAAADIGDADALARQVTADPDVPTVHIITMNSTGPDAAATAGAGPHTRLAKPVHRSQLFDLLAQSMTAPRTAPVAVAPVSPAPAAPAPSPGSRGRVLLVEDNDLNQMVAVGILTGLGYRTDVAGDGAQAVEMAAATSYDAILMDCRMPRMDGFTATARLREREGDGPRTPIIAMTASALVADRERCLAAGMDDYLAKPVSPAELQQTLDKWLTGSTGTAVPDTADDDGGDDPIGRRLRELSGDGASGGPDLVARLVTSFVERAPHHVAAIAAGLDAGDTTAVENQAHSLKGAAGTIGATAFAAVCDRLETAGRCGDLTGTAGDLVELRAELSRVQRRLRSVGQPQPA
jgi:two-component system sensor histidine kinase/response regulator